MRIVRHSRNRRHRRDDDDGNALSQLLIITAGSDDDDNNRHIDDSSWPQFPQRFRRLRIVMAFVWAFTASYIWCFELLTSNVLRRIVRLLPLTEECAESPDDCRLVIFFLLILHDIVATIFVSWGTILIMFGAPPTTTRTAVMVRYTFIPTVLVTVLTFLFHGIDFLVSWYQAVQVK